MAMAKARTKPSMDHTMIFYDDEDHDVVVNGDYPQFNERQPNPESLMMENQQVLNDQIENVDDLTHKFHQTTIDDSDDQYCQRPLDHLDIGGCDQNHSIQSLIHYAAINNQIDLMKKILANNRQKETDWHSLVNCLDSESNTPLLVAASNGHREMVRFLLEHGSLVNAQNCFDNTSLHEAAWKGFSETLEILCNHQPSRRTNRMGDQLETTLKLHLKNKQGHTALHLAAQKGHNQSTRTLLLAGCRANVKNNFGDTPLHSASRYGHIGVCRILISAFANVNELNKNDDTALHIAAAMDRKKLVKILLETGCNPTIVNRQGETPMNIALRKSYFDIQELIASPPPLKPKYLNNNSNLWCGHSNRHANHKNHHRYDKQRCFSGNLGMMTKSDTYSYDQLSYAHDHNHLATRKSHNNDDGDVTDHHKLWPTITNPKMKRCKSDFSASNHHRHHQNQANYRNVTTTPTTQASSQQEYRKKRHGKRRTVDQLNDTYTEMQLDEDVHSPYGVIGPRSNHHQPYHHHPHSNSAGSNSHHYELTAPKLETLPREPLKKGERYYMDLAGHIHKGPIGDKQNMLKSIKTNQKVLTINTDHHNVNYLQNGSNMHF